MIPEILIKKQLPALKANNKLFEIIQLINSISYRSQRYFPVLLFPENFDTIFESQELKDGLGYDNKPQDLPKIPIVPVKPIKKSVWAPEEYNQPITKTKYSIDTPAFLILLFIGAPILFMIVGGFISLIIKDVLNSKTLTDIFSIIPAAIISVSVLIRFGIEKNTISINNYIKYTNEEKENIRLELEAETNKSFEKRIEQYNRQYDKYKKEKESYPKRCESYKRYMQLWEERINTPASVDDYLKKKIQLIRAKNYQRISEPAQRGYSENTLLAALDGFHFFNNVKVDTTMSGYYPDIAVWINQRIGIDIEIDEPYDFISKKKFITSMMTKIASM